jgi:MoxR-like ATPase
MAGFVSALLPFRLGAPPVDAVVQGGGFIPRPIVYVDDDGRAVSLEEVKKKVKRAVERAVEDEDGRKAAAVRRAADRALADLSASRAAAERDIRRLRGALAESRVALESLERAIEAQRDEDAALALLLS